jgi:FixJ family two-component response regulator
LAETGCAINVALSVGTRVPRKFSGYTGYSRMKRLCIAVVDDEPAVRKGLSRLLRTADFDPRTYESAQEFLDDLAYASPDCVVVDLQMPGVSGMDLQAILRRIRARFPVIIVTGRDDAESYEKCLALGAAACLSKPLDCDTLVDMINSVVAPRA